MGFRGQRHAPAALPPGMSRYSLYVREAGCAPGPVWTGAENLTPHQDSIVGPSSHQDLVGYKYKYCPSVAGTGMMYFLKYETGLAGFCFPGPDLWKLDKSGSGSHLWHPEKRDYIPNVNIKQI